MRSTEPNLQRTGDAGPGRFVLPILMAALGRIQEDKPDQAAPSLNYELDPCANLS
jgi:hypothetical protein